MPAKRLLLLSLCAILALGLILSCSSGPKPPQPGTPAFIWSTAKENYRIGDYPKVAENLALLTRSENEFTARARVWEIVVSSGVAQGFIDLAETLDVGARVNRNNPTPFRKEATLLRSAASNAALQFAEAIHQFQENDKNPKIALDFDFPNGSALSPPELKRVAAGLVPSEGDMEKLKRMMVQRGVVLSACRAVGAPEDSAKAGEMFKAGNVQTPRETLLMNMASLLHDEAQLFGPNKLDQPTRVKMLCSEAMEALAKVPPSKETKALTGKIQATMKKSKVT